MFMISRRVFHLLTTCLFYLFRFSQLDFLRTEVIFSIYTRNSYASPKFPLSKQLFRFKYDLSKVFSLLLTRWNQQYMDSAPPIQVLNCKVHLGGKKKKKRTQLHQCKHQQMLAMPWSHDAGGQRPMHSAPGVTVGPNWGSFGSASTARTRSSPISVKVHKTPPLSPDHCHGRPKQLQSIVSMCIWGVFNAWIIGKLHHKGPVGAMAKCGVSAHSGTPPCLDHLQRIVSMHTRGALTSQPVHAEEQCTPKILMK